MQHLNFKLTVYPNYEKNTHLFVISIETPHMRYKMPFRIKNSKSAIESGKDFVKYFQENINKVIENQSQYMYFSGQSNFECPGCCLVKKGNEYYITPFKQKLNEDGVHVNVWPNGEPLPDLDNWHIKYTPLAEELLVVLDKFVMELQKL